MAVAGRVGYNIAQVRLRRRVPGRRFHQRRRNDPMQLYVTESSPYARIARVVRREKRLEDRVEELTALTRTVNSPYYQINPSGRVPYLIYHSGAGIEGSQLVCYVLDHLDGAPVLDAPVGAAAIEHRRLEEYARSLLDGVSVWVRELRRPAEDRSATIIEHERQRLDRLANFWRGEIDHPLMQGGLNMPQITLACALLVDEWYPGLRWRDGRPGLAAWADAFAARRSFFETRSRETLEV